MSLISILVVLIVVGILLYLVNNYLPLDPKIRTIINVVVVIVVIIWLLKILGLFAGVHDIKV